MAEVESFPPDVEAAVASVFRSEDPLDDPNFDVVSHINLLFPNEQALINLDAFAVKLKKKIWRVDNDIQSSIRGQTRSSEDGQALLDAQVGMEELFGRIRDIKQKAELSEKMVQEITRDIKSLDNAKKNLTVSITTLNHLKMLVSGVDSLNSLAKHRQYRDAAHLLAALLNVLEHFEKYMEIGRIRMLSERIEKIKVMLNVQIEEEFHKGFAFQAEPDTSQCDVQQLSEACLVLDVLGSAPKEKLVSWFVDLQIRDYKSTFQKAKEAAWLDKIDRRFVWLKRRLASYKEHCAEIFPKSWRMSEQISARFCEVTREELHHQLTAQRETLDVAVLMGSLKKANDFESWLVSRYPSRGHDELPPEAKAAGEDGSNGDDGGGGGGRGSRRGERGRDQEEPRQKLKPSPFLGSLTSIFEKHMGVYVDAQDKTLAAMVEVFITNFKEESSASEALMQIDEEDGGDGGKTVASSGDLFRFFRDCIMQTNTVHSTSALLELCEVMKKYLGIYAKRVLIANMPKAGTLSALMLKEGEVKLDSNEQYVTCCILNTAEYCLETTQQLEEKLQQKVGGGEPDGDSSTGFNLLEEQDLFHEVITSSIQLLVRALETQCEAGLSKMCKTDWKLVVEVGDTSSYVSDIGKAIGSFVPFVRSSLAGSRKYFTNFCMKFANSFIPRVIGFIYKCKHVSTVAAEQLLLDMQSMRTVLLELHSFGSSVAGKKAPASFTRFVTKSMMKAEMVLKIVMSPHELDPSIYVETYLQLVGEDDGIAGFQKILDMKGLKKAEVAPLLEAYRSVAGESTPAKKDKECGGAAEKGTTRVRRLKRLMNRFQ